MAYQYMNSNSDLRYTCEEYAREQWGPMVTERDEVIRQLRATNVNLQKKLDAQNREAEDGRAFRKLMAAIKDQPAAQVFWDKAMAMLRISE